jgi:hypothetical protein
MNMRNAHTKRRLMMRRLRSAALAVLGFVLLPILTASAASGQQDGAQEFTVTVENVSTPGLLTTDRAMGVVPLSPGAFVVFDGDDPAFTVGQMADSGTRLIAEDGFPGPMPFITDMTEVEILKSLDGELQVGVFAAPGGTPDVPGIFPGETATFTFTASEGELLQIETMFVQSNDWFYAFGDGGLELFSGGAPVSGDVTSQLALYDAGTEIDAPPGEGPMAPPGAVQKPVQGPMDTAVGTDETLPIQLAMERHPDFPIPATTEVIRVTVDSSAAGPVPEGGDAGPAPQGGMATGAGGTAGDGSDATALVLLAGLGATALVLVRTGLARRKAR